MTSALPSTSTFLPDLTGQRVFVAGGSRAIGLTVAHAAAAAGATAIVGARDGARARQAAATIPGAESVQIDITDERSIAAAIAAVGSVDHVVATVAAHHNVAVTEIDRAKTQAAFQAKVIGPLLLVKHIAPSLPPTGSITLFSGVAAWKPSPGKVLMGITNGAVSFAAAHLARELAPIRVNAISPGIIDSGAWDGLGQDKGEFLTRAAAGTLAGRSGVNPDIADAVMWLIGAGFVSGETIHVDGGARHA